MKRGTLTVHLGKLRHVKWVSATVKVTGRRIETIRGAALRAPIRLAGLPAGNFVLSITARASDGRSVSTKRRYHACATKPARTLTVKLAGSGSGSVTGGGVNCPGTCSKSYAAGTRVTLTANPASGSSFTAWSGGGCAGTATCTVTLSADQQVTATFTSTSISKSPPPPGSYTGSNPQNNEPVTFYVSGDGTHLQDVSIPYVVLGCNPTHTFDDHLGIATIRLNADGSFSSTTTQTGVIDGATAMFTYTFNGQFTAAKATGTFREDITYNNGTSYSCTSNDQSWSATHDTQGTQAVSPSPGSYTGSNPQNNEPVTFYVSGDGTRLQDVSIPYVVLGCNPTHTFDDHLGIASITLNADGSFSSTTTQSGIIGGAPAMFTYTFNGHLHGTNASGTPRFAGQFREDITYNNGVSYACTSNDQSWSSLRDTQGTQLASPAAPGTYTGSNPQNNEPVTFHVSSGSTALQNVSIPYVVLGCVPTHTFDDHLDIASITLNADGSFSSTTTQNGIIGGAPAMFTYTFNGHLRGTNASGVQRFAGQFREDITYNNGTAYSCTSNDQSWSATRSGA